MQEKTGKNTKIIHRLQEFAQNKSITLNTIATKIGVSNSYFSKMLKSEGSMGEDILRNILLNYEEINPIWLLTGEGKMVSEQDSRANKDTNYVHVPINVWEVIQNQAASLKARDEQLSRILESQDATNKELVRQIAELNRKIDKGGDYADNAGAAVG